jgi:uncharacterized C2H2 Zn-finger protein
MSRYNIFISILFLSFIKMYQCNSCSMLFQTQRDLTWHIHIEKQKECYIYLTIYKWTINKNEKRIENR